jgi:hypothetical protein
MLQEIVRASVQDIANADHADQASAVFQWNVSNIAGLHL